MKRALGFALLSTLLMAQKPIDVTVERINDRRSRGPFAHLEITLALPKVPSPDVAASRVLVATAVDDTGRDLIDKEASEPQLEENRVGMMQAAEKPPATVGLRLKNPDRKALTVKEIAGEIELYMPSKDPNSVAEVAKFLSQSGKALSHRALKANGVEMALMSSSQIAAEKKRMLDAKRKEYTSAGWEAGEDLENMVKSYGDSLWSLDDGEVLMRVTDPNKRVQQITYVDAAGEAKFVSVRDDEGLTRLNTWGDKPQPDWKLRVSMRTTKNIVRHPFALKDVPLP